MSNYKFTGLTKNTPQAIQIGAGVFCVNVPKFTKKPTFEELVAAVTAAREDNRVLGATRGGGTFVATIETNVLDIDGMRHPLPGTVEVTGQDARFTGTTVELKEENMEHILPMSHKDEEHEGMTMTSMILPEHYLDNVLWIGNMTSGGATAIMIYQALNVDGVTITFPDTGGATIPFNYLAHQPDPDNTQYAPFHIWFVSAPDDTTGSGSGGSGGSGNLGQASSPIEGMTITQMNEFATANGIEIPASATKHSDIKKEIHKHLGIEDEDDVDSIKVDE